MKTIISKETQGTTSHQNSRKTNGVIEKQANHNSERLSSAQVLSYASRIWGPQQSATALITAETSHIIQIVKKRKHVFFSGKSEKGILSGIFYLLAMKNRILVTQRQIARRLGTTDVTVRASYRDWIDNFPDFFPVKTRYSSRALPDS